MSLLRSIATCVLLFAALPSGAGDAARVPAADLIEAARAAVLSKAAAAGLMVRVDVAGRVQDLPLPAAASGPAQLMAGRWQEPWLRPRIGVPVVVEVGGRETTATVWLAVSAPAQGAVYQDGFARGVRAESLRYTTGEVDLARTHGMKTVAPTSMEQARLRRAVREGDPVLASDFEPMPIVSARQLVSLHTTKGAISLSIPGRALGDGDAGETISVLPSNATRPVRARVVSNGVVTLED